jgi:hypothetical protein
MIFESNEMLFFAGGGAILVVAFLALAVVFVRWRRAGARDMQRLFRDVELLRGETRTLVDLVQGVSGGLSVLEERMEPERSCRQQRPAMPRGMSSP